MHSDKKEWVRLATEADCTRRSKFYKGKIISNNPNKCSHAWLRYSGFDECKHCGMRS